ncbi:hypothetical protein LOTGIDRAFT_173823 [Lottia gigantea]|uniref:Cadherin domain-containing protein n=1 Tax=Lottia gigantea TaxID=225164 RepID=V4AZK7_LOTGI|nr:hypothetical protein LOTGIDRAFT_173823 [Lottia gigantea]ESO99181.1 hypothetical protein LOTGIDRAFT_173823 [Lottia gigantea]
MVTNTRTFLVLLFFNLVLVKGQITIDSLPTSATVNEYETANICVHKLDVTDSADNSTGYSCALNPTNSKFSIARDPTPNDKYCINYIGGPGPFSASESVTVECTNSLSETDSKLLTVDPKKNEPPQISPTVSTTVDVATASPGTLVYTLSATDSDSDSLTYTLISPATHFIIGTNDGSVKTTKDLKSVTTSTETLDITVTDSYTSPVPFQLIITYTIHTEKATYTNLPSHFLWTTAYPLLSIEDLNTEPTITNAPSAPIKVKEDVAAGHSVYKCVVDDPTPGSNDPPTTSATFNPATTDLEFDAAACEIKVSGKLKDEVQKTYTVQINVDDGFLSKPYDIEIEVEHVPSTITINNLPDTTTVKEKQDVDICLKTLNVTNTGAGGFLCELTTVDLKFAVTKRNGAADYCVYYIYDQSRSLDEKSYLLDVKCTNDEGVADTKKVKIDVQLNNAPSVPKSVGEVVDVATTSSGSPLYTINATDPDGDPLIFTVLSQDPADAGFTLGADDGSIWSSQDLRFSNNPSVTMEVEISDGRLKSTTMVTLTMTNLNIAPVITNLADINAAENTEKGEEIYKCNVQDDTVYGDGLTFSAIFNPPNNALVFDSTKCAIKISDNEKLDYEKQKAYNVTITVNDGFKQADFPIKIEVVNENDPPVFTVTSYPEEVEEGVAGDITFTPAYQVTDPEGNDVSYEIVNTGPAIFQITNAEMGTITNVAEIDFENLAANPIPVTVKVKDDTSGDAEATVYVTIKDANDNKPIFEQQLYDFNISLSTPGSTKLTTVKATDLDSTTNAEISYRLKGTSEYFEVLPSGDVILKSKINVPYGSILTAEIVAEDAGTPTTLIGTTTISGVWNKAPVINLLPEFVTIAEDQTEARDLFVFTTTDPENDSVNCKVDNIVSDAPAGETDGAFNVVKKSGAEEFTIRYSGSYKFNQGKVPMFDIFVTCDDGNGGSANSSLNVRVTPNKLPEATCNPIDSQTVSALNSAINTKVYDIGVVDQEDDPLIITFTSVPDNGFYGYDAASRSIQVRKDLRIEKESSYTWTLEIDDQKHFDSSGNPVKIPCTIYITVTDLNKAPVFSKEDQTVSLPEDTAKDSVVHTFAVIDADNTTIACDVDPISEANMFEIDPKLKTIKLAPGKEFDFEGSHQTYKFICTATDSYQSATSTLTMMITDTNDRPVFKKPLYTSTIDEGMPGTVTINAEFSFTDEEMSAGQTYAYSLESSPESVLFDIDPDTGIITNVKEIDVDAAGAPETIQLTVKVTDSEGAEETTKLDINIRDINDKTPVFDPNVYEYTLAENMGLGEVLGSITATDEDKDDINKNIVYSLDEPNDFFDVTPDGKFTLMKSLVGQYGNTFPVKVKATDTGVNPGTKSITAPVIFKWNEKPTINNLDTVVSIKEDRTGPMDVAGSTIDVTDPDGDDVECELFSITPNTDAFKVEGKKVRYTFKRPLVYRDVSSYLAQIECRDTVGGGRDQKSLQIDIEKNHDPEPNCFPSGSAKVDVADDKYHKQGGSVYVISTTDDENDAITYTLENGPPPGSQQAFTVGKFDGKITTTGDLRYIDREPVRELIIAVADAKQNTVTCTIIVTMENLNEPPKFTNLPTTVDVDESLKPEGADRELYTVELEDLVSCSDPIGISWDVDPSADKDFFTIVQTDKSVKISVAKGQELNHEKDPTNNQYKFTIRAQDGCLMESSQVLTINVKDLNEPPEFLNGDKYYANISQVWVFVDLMDLFCTARGVIGGTFVVQQQSYDNPGKINARGLGKDHLVETGIIDLGCQGTDPDTADKLTLELTGTGSEQFKVVDHAKCHIQLIGEYLLDKPDSKPNSMDLKMKLTDRAGEEVEADVKIDIWDYNNHAPEFEEPAYTGAPIYPGDAVGKDLGKVVATDDDITEATNGAVEYYLKSCNNGGEQFVSVLGDGSVKLKQSPALVGISSGTIFNCKVEARDKGIKPGVLTGTTLFDVLYTDPPPTPPPATEDPNNNDDDNNDNNNNNNNNNNANGNNNNANNNLNGNGGNSTTTDTDNFLESPAAIALLSVLGALLLALLLFAICRCCCGYCGGGGTGCMNGGSSGPDPYGGRATSPSQVQVSEGK